MNYRPNPWSRTVTIYVEDRYGELHKEEVSFEEALAIAEEMVRGAPRP